MQLVQLVNSFSPTFFVDEELGKLPTDGQDAHPRNSAQHLEAKTDSTVGG